MSGPKAWWQWVRDNPGKASMYGTAGTVSVVTLAAPAAVAAAGLGAVGFGSSGVVGGEFRVRVPVYLPRYLT